MRYQKKRKRKSINPIQIGGIALVSLAVIFACSWFSYSVNSSGDALLSSTPASGPATDPVSSPAADAPVKEPAAEPTSVPDLPKESASRSSSAASRGKVSKEEITEVKTDIFSEEFVARSMDQKLSELEKLFPDCKYWTMLDTGMTQYESGLSQEEACLIVSDESCDHNMNGYEYCHEYDGRTLDEYSYDYNVQCLGFASMISDALFGTGADIETFYDFDELAVGDHVRFLSAEHSAIVIEKTEGAIRVLECNRDYEDCMIEWGRSILAEDLEYGEYGSYEFLRRVD